MNKLLIYFLLKNLSKIEKKINKLHTRKYYVCKKIDDRVRREVEI